jgi:hypothetical protein
MAMKQVRQPFLFCVVVGSEMEKNSISCIRTLFLTVVNVFSAKFTENDHEKVDRLMELHDKYFRYVIL